MRRNRAQSIGRREFVRMTAAAPIALAASTSGANSETRQKMEKLNILYIMTDQHRADCVGYDGNPAIKTPNLDRLAGEGVYFTSAYTSTPSCTPARAALLTGLSPWNHGMLGYWKVAPEYPFEMGPALRDAGYYVFGIGKMHWHPQRTLHGYHGTWLDESGRAESPDFISDYRQWFKEQAPDLDPDATGITWNDYRAWPYRLPEELHPTHWTGMKAVEFIEDYDRSEPFMLKVSFARPHSPYDPPQRFWDMYRDEDMPAPFVGDWAAPYAEHDDPPNPSLWHGDLGVEQARRSRRGYYGSVTFIDEKIGEIIQALEKRGWLENTFIIFFTDHGDMLGDHHHWRKTYAYEGSARIPMLIRWPKSMGMGEQRGRRLPQPVELRDVLPTFLDVAGAEIPDHLDGMSLLRLVRGETDGWREWIDLEHAVCYSQENQWTALTDGKWKYIYHSFDGRQQLFDLETDPGELHDLASDPAHAQTVQTWRQRMIEHLAERGEPFVVNGDLGIRKETILTSSNYPGKG